MSKSIRFQLLLACAMFSLSASESWRSAMEVLERENAGGARIGVLKAGECKHRRNVLLVGGADGLHLIAAGQVVVAAGKLQSSLQDVGSVVFGIVETGRDPEPEDIRGLEVGIVQGVHIGAQGFAEGAGKVGRGVNVVDGGELSFEGTDAARFDGALVHEGGVEVGDLALVRAGRGVGVHDLLDDGGYLLVAAVGKGGED